MRRADSRLGACTGTLGGRTTAALVPASLGWAGLSCRYSGAVVQWVPTQRQQPAVSSALALGVATQWRGRYQYLPSGARAVVASAAGIRLRRALIFGLDGPAGAPAIPCFLRVALASPCSKRTAPTFSSLHTLAAVRTLLREKTREHTNCSKIPSSLQPRFPIHQRPRTRRPYHSFRVSVALLRVPLFLSGLLPFSLAAIRKPPTHLAKPSRKAVFFCEAPFLRFRLFLALPVGDLLPESPSNRFPFPRSFSHISFRHVF